MLILTPQDLDRFWSKVNRTDNPEDCWNWTAFRNKKGYGYFSICSPKKKNLLSHRTAYLIANGELPDNLCVCHRCDNPSCCNPHHLFLGTIQENTADRERKGRTARGEKAIGNKFVTYEKRPRGERCGASKMSEEQIKEIRHLMATRRRYVDTVKSIAAKFGLDESTVKDISNRKTWAHIP